MRTLFLLGGSGDIGSAIADKFKEKGVNVISPTRQELDLEDRSSLKRYFKKNKCDADIIINCAGYNQPKPFEELTFFDIDKTNSINVTSFYKIIQYLLPGIKKKGNGYILAISSIYGIYSRQGRLPYSMSKHALNGLVKTLALELGPHNIKVNALSPGFVDTKMTRRNNDPETIRNLESKIPLGRMAKPEEIAEIAYMLCTEENNYINGQNIIVDGGYSVGGFQN